MPQSATSSPRNPVRTLKATPQEDHARDNTGRKGASLHQRYSGAVTQSVQWGSHTVGTVGQSHSRYSGADTQSVQWGRHTVSTVGQTHSQYSGADTQSVQWGRHTVSTVGQTHSTTYTTAGCNKNNHSSKLPPPPPFPTVQGK